MFEKSIWIILVMITDLFVICFQNYFSLVCANKKDLKDFAALTTFPSILCAPSRKNALSQGLALIQVKSFQLPALGPSCKCCGEFFCSVFAEIAHFPSPRTPCIGTAAAGADAHASNAKGLQVHEDRGSFLHLCCKKGERLKLRRDGDGGRERERRLLCFPSPPPKQRGNVSAERR